ncbi:hypothetical protein BGW41_002981 [Actinomortierella wolfii]|nr:hypothetical protein BGW41_002981 [Actinomortierella wolfii]
MADQKEDGGDYDDQLDARASFKKSPRTLSSLSTLPSTGGHCLQTKADTDTDTDTEIFDKRTSAFDNVNPYLQVLKSNIRRLRKRLSRIKKTETVLAKGSKKDKERIQSEQYLAIEDKSKITVSIELLETLRETMADIASKASKAPQDPQDIVDNPNASSMAGQKGIEEKIQTDVSLLKSVIKLFAAHQLLLSPKSGLDGTLAECRETLSSICQSFVSCLDESVDSNERLMVQAKRLFEG